MPLRLLGLAKFIQDQKPHIETPKSDVTHLLPAKDLCWPGRTTGQLSKILSAQLRHIFSRRIAIVYFEIGR